MIKIAVIVLSLGLVGLFLGFHKPNKDRADRMFDELSSKLDLTENQRAELKLIVDDFRKVKEDVNIERQKHREDFINILAAESFDPVDIQELVEKGQQNVDEYASRLVENVGELHESLNLEQRIKLVDEIKKHAPENGNDERGYHHSHWH